MLLLLGTGLVLSHAGAWWLGEVSRGSSGRSSAAANGNGSAKPAADADPAWWTPEAFAQRGKERNKALRAAAHAAELAAEQEPEWSEQVDAAERKLLASGRDPAAILKELSSSKEAQELAGIDFNAEHSAAFRLWIARDPAAALAWAGPIERDHGGDDFAEELKRWIGSGGHLKVGEYLDRFPLIADNLFNAAEHMAVERGPAFTLELAAKLTDPEERTTILHDGFDEIEKFSGHLAQLRGLMNDLEATYFLMGHLTNFGRIEPELLEEIRQAGFPAKALAKFESFLGEEYGDQEGDSEGPLERGDFRRMAANGSGGPADLLDLRIMHISDIRSQVPEFKDWHADVIDRRLTPAELMTRLAEAWPLAAQPEAQAVLRRTIGPSLMKTAPVETLRWLRESDGGDWQEDWQTMGGQLDSLNPEQIASVVADLPPDMELTENDIRTIRGELADWHEKDAVAYRQAEQRLADEVREGQASIAPMMPEMREGMEARAEKRRQRQQEEERAKREDLMEDGDEEEEAGP